jgi:plastocyanin
MTVTGESARRRPRLALVLGAAGAAAWLAAVPPSAGAAGQAAIDPKAAVAVAIDGHAYAPAAITIAAGATVTWKNADDTVHNVVADDRSFRSGALDTGDSYAHTFTTPGEYTYYCSLHPYMTGKIIVRPAGNSS